MFAYTVSCTFTDAGVAEQWERWLREEHLADVCACGASAARLVRLDGPEIRYEARYEFASRGDFDAYERDHAPRLRAEGLERFPLELGLRYERSTGDVVAGAP